MKMMKKYYIKTDSGSEEIEASNLAAALEQWGESPSEVKTAGQWEDWLSGYGGYGIIEEDGIQIARVAS